MNSSARVAHPGPMPPPIFFVCKNLSVAGKLVSRPTNKVIFSASRQGCSLMDPIAHTFTGAALAASGLRRATPLATAALVLGANAPDIDIVAAFGPDFSSVAHRRGWTHGLPAIAAFPFLVTGLLLAWDRLVRLRLRPGAAPIRAGPLLGIAALGVATHSTLDWLNNYGIRWLMPFDGQWFYGDALFIIDPWIWLALGGSLFLMHARRIPSLAAWCAFWLLASVLVFATADVPQAARWLWVAGIGVLLGARAAGLSAPARERGVERVTRAALVVCVAYMAAASIANITARAEVRAALAVRGFGPVGHLMIGPVPGQPVRWRRRRRNAGRLLHRAVELAGAAALRVRFTDFPSGAEHRLRGCGRHARGAAFPDLGAVPLLRDRDGRLRTPHRALSRCPLPRHGQARQPDRDPRRRP